MKKKLLLPIMAALIAVSGFGQSNLVVDPNVRHQTMEGWGVSLAWWAHIAGGWSDASIDSLCTWLTSPQGLNMNVFRFNIAGEENPAHNHMGYGRQLEGYKVSSSAPYDYTRDATQRKILLKLKEKRNDCVFEAICYSPPYWMTKSGCTSGNTDGSDNLQDAYVDDYADYLTTVVKYYHDNLGITFRTLAAVNEPSSNWWVANGSQAGSHFSSAKQVELFNELYSQLQAKSMLSYCTLSGVDASKAAESITELNAFANQQMISKISQINTHSYNGPEETAAYQQLYNLATQHGKRIWQSETGPLGMGYDYIGFDNNLRMNEVLLRDMHYLKPSAWCQWQYMSTDQNWGNIQFLQNGTFERTIYFYSLAQFTRFIKKDYTILHTNNTATLAGMNAANDTLALVINNSSSSDQTYTIDLGLFGATGSNAQVYRTLSGMGGLHRRRNWDLPYKVHTYQTKTGLANGTYTAKAWVRSNGGQTQCIFRAKDFGGTELIVNIPTTAKWTQVTIPSINVSNGQCTIGFYSDSPNWGWAEFDDVEFYLNSTPATNLLSNPDFELDNQFSGTITGWQSADSVGADFVQRFSRSHNELNLRLSDAGITAKTLVFTAKAKSTNTLIIPVTAPTPTVLASGNYRITAKHSSKDMSVTGWSSTDGAVMEQWTPLGQSNQVFNIQQTPTGYKLLPSYNDKVVTVDGYSNANGGVINQWTDYEQSNQRFSIIDAGGGYYKIMSLSSGKFLAVTGAGTANGDDIVQWQWLDHDNFKWQLTPVALPAPVSNGTYTLKVKHSSKVMTVQAGSSADNAIVEQWSNLCQANQRFVLTYTDSGYTIKPEYNSKLVTVKNFSVANGAGLVQLTDTKAANQRFEIQHLGSSEYKIINRYTNKALAVIGSGTANGDDIVQWQWFTTGNDNFKWSFETPCGSLFAAVPATVMEETKARMALTVFPNPAATDVQVVCTGLMNPVIQVFDMNGKLQWSRNYTKGSLLIPASIIGKGMYIVKAVGTNGTLTSKLLIQ